MEWAGSPAEGQLERSKSSASGLRPTEASKCLRVILIACCAAALTACATPSGPATVQVPVAVSCMPHTTPQPPVSRATAELSLLDDHQLVLTIASEWYELKAYAQQASALIEACR